MYTLEQLEDRSMTKAKMAEIILDLQSQVNASSSTPISSSQLIERKLQLADKTAVVSKEIAEIKATADVEIARIKAEAELNMSRKMDAIISDYEGIQKDVANFEKATESEIAVKEAEAVEAIESIELSVKQAKDEAEDKLTSIKATVEAAQLKAKTDVIDINTKHEREIDEVRFKNSQAIRDENAEFVVRAADRLNLALIRSEELDEIKETAAKNIDGANEDKEKAVAIATNSVKSKYESQIKDIKHESELTISKLKVSEEVAGARIEGLMRDNAKLQEQVAAIPAVIRDAVAAAKSEVNVSQDAGKK